MDRLHVLILLLASLVVTKSYLVFCASRQVTQNTASAEAMIVPPAWCSELSPEELVTTVTGWRCVYGGEEGFDRGQASFRAEVWGGPQGFWWRVAEDESRLDPAIYTCPTGSFVDYRYEEFGPFLTTYVMLRECGYVLCRGNLRY